MEVSFRPQCPQQEKFSLPGDVVRDTNDQILRVCRYEIRGNAAGFDGEIRGFFDRHVQIAIQCEAQCVETRTEIRRACWNAKAESIHDANCSAVYNGDAAEQPVHISNCRCA